MRSTGGWCCFALLCILVPLALAHPLGPDPSALEELDAPSAPTEEVRDKREVGIKVAAGLGVKNFLLDFVFGKVNQVIDYKTQLVTQFDRSNRYKNYYLLNLGTQPRGVASKGGASGQGGGFGGVGDGGVSTTTEDIPVFDSNRVSLDLPPALFGSGFSLITNVSKIVGEVVLNTAQRTQRFVDALRPVFGRILKIETNTIDRSKRDSIPSDVARLAEEIEARHMDFTTT